MKTVLITGASRGIGRETVRQFVQAGFHVFAGVRNPESAKADWGDLPSGPGRIEVVALDVTQPATVLAAAESLTSRIPHLDVLVNNAGIVGSPLLDRTSVENLRQVFETNFFGVVTVTRAFLPLLRRGPEPRIVNVSSGLGSLTGQSDPTWEFYPFKSAYFTSKTALNAYTVWLAYDLKDEPFKVNAVDPGYTATEFNNFRGPGAVEDAAAVVIKYSTLGSEGPTGGFFDRAGRLPW